MSAANSGNLNNVLDPIIQKLIEAVKQTVPYAEQVTKGYAPVKTGKLQSEITAEQVDEYSFKLESPTEYAPFVNYGTVKMAANPFFDRGTEDTRTKFMENLNNAAKSK